MRNYILGLFIFPILAQAEPTIIQKDVLCDNVKTVIETLISVPYNEQPVWSGKDSSSRYVMLLNRKTGTWSLVQFNDKAACVLGTGTDSTEINMDRLSPK